MTQEYYEARKCYSIAADLGSVPALYYLGVCYYNDQKFGEAVKCYKKAAEKGDGDAMSWMGCCYENGQGVTKDLQEAIKWYKLGAKNGNEDSKKALERLGVSQ